MRTRPLLATLVCSVAFAGLLAPGASPGAATGITAHLSCIAPGDAPGIDAALERAQSPLAGEGSTFVAEGRRVGVDPRALVAIAAHETMLATYAPAQRIRNAFGLGPGWSFESHGEAIARAATTLDNLYLPEGRIDIPSIGAKWAPIGAANDPTGLNQHWSSGVGTYYRALGGEPAEPILLDAQPAVPDCAADDAAPADPPAAPPPAQPEGTPVVTAWGGVSPVPTGDGPAGGVDPAGGEAATIAGFVFPLALARGARADYADVFSLPGPVECGELRAARCAVIIETDAGVPAVAASAGTLEHADASSREEGVAFWLVTESGDRLGYGPLAAYGPGVGAGTVVMAGQRLGTAPDRLRFAWERDGLRLNPYPLLSVTRSASGGA